MEWDERRKVDSHDIIVGDTWNLTVEVCLGQANTKSNEECLFAE